MVRIDVDADPADNSELLALDRYACAFEFSRADIQLVIQFVLVQKLPTFEVDQEIGGSVTQMSTGDIVFERNQRMRGIGQIVQENFDPSVGKRFSDKPHNPLVVLEELVGVIDDSLAVILVEQLRVNFLLGWLELVPDVVLFTDENELTRGRVILVLEEVMHAESEIVQVELAKIFARDRERIKIVFLDIATELSATFLVFSPNETGAEKKQRCNDRCDDVHADLALQRVHHGGYFGLQDRHHHKFPAAFESVMLSTATFAGCDKA